MGPGVPCEEDADYHMYSTKVCMFRDKNSRNYSMSA